MQLRMAKIKDMDAISGLLERCYPVLMSEAYATDVLASALPIMMKANPQLIASGRFYLVENDELVIGCGGWSFDTPGTGSIIEGVAHVRHFAVDPKHARKGIGQAIFKRSAFDAHKAGAPVFQAYSSLNAERFYQSMGLKRLDQINVSMGEDIEFPIVHMEGPTELQN